MAPDKRARTKKLLQLMFQEYYRTNQDSVDIPDRVHKREFALESWDYYWVCKKQKIELEDGTEVERGCGNSGRSFSEIKVCPHCGQERPQITRWSRHHGYRTREMLLAELARSVPHSVYHSAAFYQVPVTRSMIEKEWEGAELVFDIDADHLDAPCAEKHDVWQCTNLECGETGRGKSPEECPECGEKSFRNLKWICDDCLDIAKENTLKLYDKFLVKHFGIDPDNIQLNYSGHRGYHVRVKDPSVFNLDTNGRMEIAHYLTGMGLNSTIESKGRLRITPTGELKHWQLPAIARKIADAMIEFIDNIDSYQGNDKWIKHLAAQRDAAIEGLEKDPPMLSAKVHHVGAKSWQEIADRAAAFYSVEIDQPVTYDIHRVIRLIGSLNGKTGFTVTEITRDELPDFDPLGDALAFTDGDLEVTIPQREIKVPSFRIGDSKYGPYNGSVEELPKAAAVFLLCKGMATIE